MLRTKDTHARPARAIRERSVMQVIVCTVGLIVALCWGLAVSAGARPYVKSRMVSVSVRGSQATTWHLERSAESAGCRLKAVLDGSQMVRFATRAPAEVFVFQTDRRSALWPYTGTERPVLWGVPLSASVEREAEMVSDHGIYDRWGCVRQVRGQRVALPGCGTRQGTVRLSLAFTAVPSSSEEDGVDSPAPLSEAIDHLRLSGTDPQFGAGSLTSVFGGCPLFDSPTAPEAEGRLPDAWAHVSERRLMAGGTMVLHVGSVTRLTGVPGVTGQTVVTYNVTIRPVAKRRGDR